MPEPDHEFPMGAGDGGAGAGGMKFLFLSSHAHLALDTESSRVSGGAELQVALLARELVRRGHEAVIVGGDAGQEDGRVFGGVKTRTGGRFHTGGFVDTAWAVPRVLALIREEKPQYVVILGWTTWVFLLDLMKRALGYRFVFICGLDTEVNGEFRREHPVRGALFERGVRGADVRFAMTEYQERMFRRSRQTCGLYRNLILPRRHPLAAEKDIDLLWVARCQPIKRPGLFLDLVERLRGVRCEMVCPREDAALWETVAARAQTLRNLTFRERVPYHEVQDVYDRARVFVNTSTREGWPNSFIQAGLGRAALLSLDVNPDDLFARYGLGCFAHGDVEEMVDCARRVLAETEQLSAMQDECARFVVELHDNERNVEAFLGMLNR
jgi:glycosyltransferase involved in cell wall biosynthesis